MDGGTVNCWDMGRKVLGGEVDGVPNVWLSVAAAIVDEELRVHLGSINRNTPLRFHSTARCAKDCNENVMRT